MAPPPDPAPRPLRVSTEQRKAHRSPAPAAPQVVQSPRSCWGRDPGLDTHVVQVLPLLSPFSLCKPVVDHFLRPRPVDRCRKGVDA